jgi:hypothetical protein
MCLPASIPVSAGFPRSLFGFRDAAPSMKQMAARYRLLAILAARVLVLVSDQRPAPVPDKPGVIDGPYALLLAASTDLGPSHRPGAQLTVTLHDSTRPDDIDRVGRHARSVGALAAR